MTIYRRIKNGQVLGYYLILQKVDKTTGKARKYYFGNKEIAPLEQIIHDHWKTINRRYLGADHDKIQVVDMIIDRGDRTVVHKRRDSLEVEGCTLLKGDTGDRCHKGMMDGCSYYMDCLDKTRLAGWKGWRV